MLTAASNTSPAVEQTAAGTDAPDALEALEALGDAAALGSADGQRVLATTSALRSLPGTQAAQLGGSWSVLLESVDKACREGVSGGRPKVQSLPDGRRLVRIGTDMRDVQDYLAERDSLFLTSRTVSVSEMATALAHELNQPLGTLANLLAALKIRTERGDLSNEVLASTLEGATRQTRFAQSVIERINDFTASRRPEPRSLQLTDLVERSVALLDWLLVTSSVKVHTHVRTDRVSVRGDETMLQQVLINLIRNAVEAMRDCDAAQRVIDITIDVDTDRASLVIRDRGPGLDADASSAFLPFVSGKPDGMGVGLNICRSFMELHQGRLWLESHKEGGCMACIELPLESSGEDLQRGGDQ